MFHCISLGLESEMGIYCTYFISINPPGLGRIQRERASYICSELATPDPHNGAANLYAGPRPLGNEYPYFISFYLKVKKNHSQFGSFGAAGTLWPLFCSYLYFTLNFSNLKRYKDCFQDILHCYCCDSIFSLWMFPRIFTWSSRGPGCLASAWPRSSRRWESSE